MAWFLHTTKTMPRTFFVRPSAQPSNNLRSGATPRSLPLFVLCAAVLACSAEPGATPADTESSHATEDGSSETEASETEAGETEANETEAGETEGDHGFRGFAMFLSQVPDQQADPAWLADGEELDADALILVVSNLGLHCELPDTELPGVNHHVLLIGLPVQAQMVGTYEFASPEIIAWSSHWIGDGMGSGGGGSFPVLEGSVDIVALDEDTVEVRLETADIAGEFALERCPR